MSRPSRACHSCGQNSAFVRRVRCSRCSAQIHPSCRDVTDTCYACRYLQACKGSIQGCMLLPHQAGEDPFAKNRPTTATLGIDLPDVFDAEANPGGMAVNVARIVQCAQYAGWHAEQYDELRTTLVLRKHGRGYLRVYFSVMGRVISASTQRRNLAPRTARVLEYLEGK